MTAQNSKTKTLKDIGREDLAEIFDEWKPRRSKAKSKGAPLDQRVTITVTDDERSVLDEELKAIKKSGQKISMSQFVRNKALGSVDINGWRSTSVQTLREIENTKREEDTLANRKDEINTILEDDLTDEEEIAFRQEMADIDASLAKLSSRTLRRRNRLSGRMSMQEAETIKWRAQRLCISSSDYLRMMIFDLTPDSSGDAHMNFDAKRRFYVSVIDVSNNGWGDPPEIYKCSQCENYLDEIKRLHKKMKDHDSA